MVVDGMFVVAAFFPGETTAFWQGAPGRDLLGANLSRLAAVVRPGAAVLVTSQPALLAELAPACFTVASQTPPSAGEPCGALPTLSRTLAGRDETVARALFVDLLFPFPGPDNPFAACANLLAGTETSLVLSAVSCRDHPCQLVRPEVLLGTGLLPLFDVATTAMPDGTLPPGTRSSRPFPWNWSGHFRRRPGPGTAFRPDAGIEPLASEERDRALRGTDPALFLLWESPTTARYCCNRAEALRVAAAAGLDADTTLAGWSPDREGPLVVAIRRGTGLILRTAVPSPTGAVLTTQPVTPDGLVGPEVSGDPAGTVIASLPSAPSGLLYTLQSLGPDRRGDRLAPYLPEETLWRIGPDGAICCGDKGEPIAGRQGFVPVYVPDWAMAAGAGDRLAAWPVPARLPSWHPLPDLAGPRLDVPTRLFRHLARERAIHAR